MIEYKENFIQNFPWNLIKQKFLGDNYFQVWWHRWEKINEVTYNGERLFIYSSQDDNNMILTSIERAYLLWLSYIRIVDKHDTV